MHLKNHVFMTSLFMVLLLPSSQAFGAGHDLAVEDFAGHKEWPLKKPGDITLFSERLELLRTPFEFVLWDPRDLDSPPRTVALIIDVWPSYFPKGNSSFLIQWTSLGSTTGASAIDALYVDRDSFQVLYKFAARGPGEWAGPYEVRMLPPDKTVSIMISDDGEMTKNDLSEGAPSFDFASFGYLFGLMELQGDDAFRLLNVGSATDLSPQAVAIKVDGETKMEDANGVLHKVTRVRMFSEIGKSLVTFYVSSQAPFFYGWDFKSAESGKLFNRLRYKP